MRSSGMADTILACPLSTKALVPVNATHGRRTDLGSDAARRSWQFQSARLRVKHSWPLFSVPSIDRGPRLTRPRRHWWRELLDADLPCGLGQVIGWESVVEL
jgi:hypothetical protein